MTETAVDSVAGLSISADAAEVRKASAWLETVCLERDVPAEQIGRLDLCLNEALANIIAHGGPGAQSSPVQILFRLHRQPYANEAAVTVTDSGVAFDPLADQSKPLPETLGEAEPGGLGLTMLRNFSDGMGYSHVEGRNQLTLSVRWTQES